MASNSTLEISNDDLPALYRAADEASNKAQKSYLRCIGIDLILIVGSAIAGSLSFSSLSNKTILAISSAVLAGLGLILTLYIRSMQFEQNWYDGRAVAESIKTRAWRFMTRSEPYTLIDEEAENLFIENLREVLKERKRLAASLGSSAASDSIITPRMLEMRNRSFDDRKNLYITQRINNQKKWYSDKSKENQKRGNRWFNAIICCQVLILLSSFVTIYKPDLPINLISIFSAIAASFIAWLQLKRHQELANSYGLAAEELSFIAEQSRHIKTEEKLSAFILDAENAISREHTLWIARRDQL